MGNNAVENEACVCVLCYGGSRIGEKYKLRLSRLPNIMPAKRLLLLNKLPLRYCNLFGINSSQRVCGSCCHRRCFVGDGPFPKLSTKNHLNALRKCLSSVGSSSCSTVARWVSKSDANGATSLDTSKRSFGGNPRMQART